MKRLLLLCVALLVASLSYGQTYLGERQSPTPKREIARMGLSDAPAAEPYTVDSTIFAGKPYESHTYVPIDWKATPVGGGLYDIRNTVICQVCLACEVRIYKNSLPMRPFVDRRTDLPLKQGGLKARLNKVLRAQR